MIPKIEVYMHDDSVGYPRWFEIDGIDYSENTFSIIDAFGNPQEYHANGRKFRCENGLSREKNDGLKQKLEHRMG